MSESRNELIIEARKLARVAPSLGGTGRFGPSWEVMREYETTLNALCDELEAEDTAPQEDEEQCPEVFDPATPRLRCTRPLGHADDHIHRTLRWES